MEFRGLLIGVLLTGLFIVSMLTGYSILAEQNNEENILMKDSSINSSVQNISDAITNIDRTASNITTAFQEERSSFSFGFLLLSSLLDAGRQMTTMIIAIFSGSFTMASTTLGIPSIVLGIFTAIVLLSTVLLLWSVYKSGR